MIREDFIRRKLQLIGEDLGRLVRFKDLTLDELLADDIRLAAVERIIERIVMRAVDVNEHLLAERLPPDARSTRLNYRDTFLALADVGVCDPDFAREIAASAGLRNILVQDYNDVDRRILHRSIGSCLRDYKRYVEQVEAFIAGPPAP
ncbi:MAG: type VII toxin-antitoxin system HepT family RNase toxin [Ectothiorhodospira sp.]